MTFWKRVLLGARVGPEGRSAVEAASAADDLVGRIRERASSTTDRQRPGEVPFGSATEEALAAAEESLDFALPFLLKRVLREVGNGGFGPGRGLLGVQGGATDEHGSSLVDLYDSLSAKNPDDPGWRWPQRLVPLCTWGDSTYSCVDCATADGAIVTFDANDYRPGADIARFLTPQPLTLASWLGAWVDGADLWNLMFPLDPQFDAQVSAPPSSRPSEARAAGGSTRAR